MFLMVLAVQLLDRFVRHSGVRRPGADQRPVEAEHMIYMLFDDIDFVRNHQNRRFVF